MGDVLLKNLTPTTNPTSTQSLLLFDESTNAGQRINYDTLADKILTKLTSKTFTVAGGTNTLISAIDGLNSNLPGISTGTIESAIKTYVGQGKSFGHFIADKSLSDIPESSKDYKILFYREQGSNSVYVEAIANTDHRVKYIGRIYNYTVADAGLANTWQLLPTRAEMDALSNKVGSLSVYTNTWAQSITITVQTGRKFIVFVDRSTYTGTNYSDALQFQQTGDTGLGQTLTATRADDKTSITISSTNNTNWLVLIC